MTNNKVTYSNLITEGNSLAENKMPFTNTLCYIGVMSYISLGLPLLHIRGYLIFLILLKWYKNTELDTFLEYILSTKNLDLILIMDK